MISNLHDYLAIIEREGELKRITDKKNPFLEIAKIVSEESKLSGGGDVLLFEHPGDSGFPLAANLFGSLRRVSIALCVDNIRELEKKFSALISPLRTVSFDNVDSQMSSLPEFCSMRPAVTSETALTEITLPDLTTFPFLQSWPEDGKVSGHPRYITLPLLFTSSPDGIETNCGMYRCQIRGKAEIAVQCKDGSGAASHLESYRKIGRKMPVAIVLGGAPCMTFSAMFPLPGRLDEVTFAGFLQNRPLTMVRSLTVPLYVPSEAEVVLEGYIDPHESVIEGPFGNHTGSYSPPSPAPLIRLTCIRRREKPIIPATVPGEPPMEDCWMAKAWERLLAVFLRKLLPGFADIHFPIEWIFHNSGVISIEEPGSGMVIETARFLWSLPWFRNSKILLFVDASACLPERVSTVVWHAINLVEFSSDIFFDAEKRRMAIDATGYGKMTKRIKS